MIQWIPLIGAGVIAILAGMMMGWGIAEGSLGWKIAALALPTSALVVVICIMIAEGAAAA